jgi:hypothetical protein
MSTGALAERFQALGFRVIEGGKQDSSTLVISSRGVAEGFDVQHGHVLRDIRDYRKTLPPNLDAIFSAHCRPSFYSGRQNRGGSRTAFDLTETGLATIALKYDGVLRFLYALLFKAITDDNEIEADTFVGQIRARLREIRARSPQQQLDFEPTPEPEIDDDADDVHARHVWVGADIGDYMDADAPLPSLRRATWQDRSEDRDYDVTYRLDQNGKPMLLRVLPEDCDSPIMVGHLLPTVPTRLLVRFEEYVPLPVLKRAIMRADPTLLTPLVEATLTQVYGDIERQRSHA